MDETKDDVTLDTPNEETTTEETTEEVDQEKEQLKEENKKLFARAKKAEGFELVNGEWIKKPKTETREEPRQEGLSDKDLLFLARTDIHEDNLDELKDWARFKKIPLSEAYKQLKPKFDTDAEIRRSAEVTTTGSRRAPTGKISDEAFLKKMQEEIPEPGSADAERLFELRHKKN